MVIETDSRVIFDDVRLNFFLLDVSSSLIKRFACIVLSFVVSLIVSMNRMNYLLLNSFIPSFFLLRYTRKYILIGNS